MIERSMRFLKGSPVHDLNIQIQNTIREIDAVGSSKKLEDKLEKLMHHKEAMIDDYKRNRTSKTNQED